MPEGPLGAPRPLGVGPLTKEQRRRRPGVAVVIRLDDSGKELPQRESDPQAFQEEIVPLEQEAKRINAAFTEEERIGVEVRSPTEIKFELGKAPILFFVEELDGITERMEEMMADQGYTVDDVKVGCV